MPCEFAQNISSAIRLSDLAVRMGGDESLLILPECRIEQVSALLAHLRPLTVNLQGSPVPFEFSAGYVSYQQSETRDAFLDLADKTLYTDKRAGKTLANGAPAFH